MKFAKCLKTLLLGASVCASMAYTSISNAAPITWNFNNATFADGGTLAGWFSIESANGDVVDWDFQTTAGASLPGFHYTSASSDFYARDLLSANSYLFVRTTPFAQPYINLAFLDDLMSEGAVNFNIGSSWECNNCGPIRYLASGSVTSNNVPEPATLGILGLGLLGMAAARRKSKNKVA